MTITALRSRTEAIDKIPTPRAPKQCKSFCGVVNYFVIILSRFTEIIKAHSRIDKKRKTIYMGRCSRESF